MYASRNRLAVPETLGAGSHGQVQVVQGNTAPGGTPGGDRPAGLQVARVVVHEQRDLKRWRRLQPPDGHGVVAPASGPIGHQVAREAAVEFEQERFVEAGR